MNHPRHPFVDRGRAQVFAHRGDRARHPPGNRAAAFRAALDLGVDHLESDAHLTADGEVVLFHDDRVDDTTTASGLVSELEWDQLATAGYVVDGSDVGEGPMRLADALERWPDAFWNLDAKHDRVVDPLVDVVRAHGAEDRVLLTSFSAKRLGRMRRLVDERTATGHGRNELAALRVLAWLRLPLPRRGDAVQVPERWKGVRVVDRVFVRACHRAGIAVHVWTVDDPDRMEALFDLGVDAVMTDRPDRAREVLQRLGRW